jgi:hypothetical protein
MAHLRRDDARSCRLYEQRQAEESDQPEDLAATAVTAPLMPEILEDTPLPSPNNRAGRSLGRDHDGWKTAGR